MLGFLKRLAPIGIITLLSFWVWKPLLTSGFFTMHDDQQVARLYELNSALMAGQFPVRWVMDLGFGFGYALFNFYPPLVYYLGEIYHLFGLGFIDASKVVWFTAILGSGLAMYFLAKEFFGKTGGMVAGLFYIYAPYHAVDAYIRGALAELFSFVWLPLVFWATYKKKTVLTGFFLALLMVTHNLIFLPFMAFFAVWAWVYDRKSLILSPLMALALTAFFWMPELWEKQDTLVDQILIKNLASYRIHFVCWSQLWSSPWGFGGSVAGCNDGLSFVIGRLHILTVVVGLGVGLFLRKQKTGRVLILATALFALSVFMTTTSSQFIWDKLPLLWYLQFPWRFLEFSALLAAFLAGCVGLIPSKIVRYVAAGGLVAGLVAINAKYFQPQKYLLNATDKTLITDSYLKWQVSSSSFEFMPKGIETYINSRGVVWPMIDESTVRNSEYQVKNGELTTSKEYFDPGKFGFLGNSPAGAKVTIQQTYFPGWQILLDGKPVAIDKSNSLELMSFLFPAGRHQVTGQFSDTPVRTAGNLISLGSIILVGGYYLYGTRRGKT